MCVPFVAGTTFKRQDKYLVLLYQHVKLLTKIRGSDQLVISEAESISSWEIDRFVIAYQEICSQHPPHVKSSTKQKMAKADNYALPINETVKISTLSSKSTQTIDES